jgi:hypothetical protein
LSQTRRIEGTPSSFPLRPEGGLRGMKFVLRCPRPASPPPPFKMKGGKIFFLHSEGSPSSFPLRAEGDIFLFLPPSSRRGIEGDEKSGVDIMRCLNLRTEGHVQGTCVRTEAPGRSRRMKIVLHSASPSIPPTPLQDEGGKRFFSFVPKGHPLPSPPPAGRRPA